VRRGPLRPGPGKGPFAAHVRGQARATVDDPEDLRIVLVRDATDLAPPRDADPVVKTHPVLLDIEEGRTSPAVLILMAEMFAAHAGFFKRAFGRGEISVVVFDEADAELGALDSHRLKLVEN